ncbi:MAG: DHHA1 domain-containing protein [Acidobacteria bacterium]|nr:DHHA1 domain-containing protein [Acidobacteriota bacterium]
MTDRLYYTDSYLCEFDAAVLRVERESGRPAAILDRTAFYPTSGGQPFDIGTLGGANVVDVVDREDGTIAHVIEGALAAGAVRGAIDWPRRFDHMQQHTGQHILSAAFDRLHGAATVSVHLGARSCTIDLGREVTPDGLASAEQDANRVVWEDRTVSVRFVGAEQAAAMPLRKEPARPGPLRLIEVADYDLSACGGTHVARTGSVGLIAVSGWERFKGGVRVEFVCGGRALGAFRAQHDAVTGSVRLLSVLPSVLPAAIERVQCENKDLKRALKGLQDRLAGYEALTLAAGGERIGGAIVVLKAMEGWDGAGLKTLAAAIAARPGHAAILISASNPALIVISRAPGLPLDPAGTLQRLTAQFGGKGGGRGDLAQGGGLAAEPPVILDAARQLLSESPL